MALPDSPQQQLEFEARQRPRAAIATAVAALLVFGGQIGRELALQNAPKARFLDALEGLQAPGSVQGRPSLQVGAAEYLSDNALSLLLPSIVEGLGYFALAYGLTFLAAATRARRGQFPRIALYLPAIGGVLMGVSTIGRAAGRLIDVKSFLDGPRTVASAQDIGLGGLSLVAEVVSLPAVLALATALVLVSMNAMRAGLLTRFMGILGVIVGALQVIRIGPLPLVQTFWLLGLALLFAGRGPGPVPPAWRTGREEPWPSQQEIAAARAKQAAERRGEPEPEPDPEPETVPAGAESAAARRKRKRRR